MDYNLSLKVYEGPMDLLLDLIKKNEVDIYDIPIHVITSEFLDYIKKANEINLELTSDFIVMASTLIEIKSKMLLPVHDKEDDEEEQEDPRQTLVNKIIEYEKYKEASEQLREQEEYEMKAFYKLQEDFNTLSDLDLIKDMNVDALFKSFQKLIKKNRNKNIITEIKAESFPVEKATNIIKEILSTREYFLFSEIMEEYFLTEEVIAFFLSILEMIKVGNIRAVQVGNYEDIEVRRRD